MTNRKWRKALAAVLTGAMMLGAYPAAAMAEDDQAVVEAAPAVEAQEAVPEETSDSAAEDTTAAVSEADTVQEAAAEAPADEAGAVDTAPAEAEVSETYEDTDVVSTDEPQTSDAELPAEETAADVSLDDAEEIADGFEDVVIDVAEDDTEEADAIEVADDDILEAAAIEDEELIAQGTEGENAEDVYVLMNIPYDVFYGITGTTSGVDVVSSATAKVRNSGVAGYTYNGVGSNTNTDDAHVSKGVTFPVKAAASILDDSKYTKVTDETSYDVAWFARGQRTDTTVTGEGALIQAPDYAYYILTDKPANYLELTADGLSSEIKGNAAVTSTLSSEAITYGGHHRTYEISLGESYGTISAVKVVTNDGTSDLAFGLKTTDQIWRSQEIGWDPTGNLAATNGATLKSITVYSNTGVYEITVNQTLTKKYNDGSVSAELKDKAGTIAGLPSDISNAKATVSYTEGSGRSAVTTNYIENTAVTDGTFSIPEGKLTSGTEYTVTVSSDNYIDFSTSAAYSVTPSTEAPDTPSTEAAAVTSLKITASPSKNITAGKKVTLTAAVTPANAATTITWKSSNEKYATVNSKGVVTTKKNGAGKTVTITATSANGKTAKVTIKIKKGKVTKITLKAASKTVKAGKSVKITATVKATKGANKKLKWTSSNTKWATVTSSGKVKTKKAGKGHTVRITARATDGSGKKKTIKIKIK